MSEETSDNYDKSPSRGSRRWLFRLLAIGFGLLLILLAEIGCRLAGWGPPEEQADPFAGIRDVQPLFVRDGDEYRISESKRNFFASDSFPANKPAKTYRIFCLGGSTVQGRPYSIPTSFTTFTEIGLNLAAPSVEWEVVNCGGISYASYRLVPILEEVLNYEPDLIVICTGHNEFLEDRSYAHLKESSQTYSQLVGFFRHSALFWTIQNALHQNDQTISDPRPELEPEVDAILDYNDSLKLYFRDDAWREGVASHYEFNLRRMRSICEQAGVPMMLIRPPSNLADLPPFKSQFSEELSSSEKERVRKLASRARQLYQTDLDQAIALLEKAIELDERFAILWYELGQCLQTRHRIEEARFAFLRAREEDICPLRMTADLERKLFQVANETETTLIDAFALLERETTSGILDDQLLVDHVHPSFKGHQMIAVELIQRISEWESVSLKKNWKSDCENRFTEYLQSLENQYFLEGQETLKALRGWAAGRAQAAPAEERFPHRVPNE